MKSELPFGSSPNALSISPDGRLLYVANGTENAICVIETEAPNRIDEDTFNRIIRHAMKGYNRPYPELPLKHK